MDTHAGFTATPTELGWKKLSNIGEDGIDHDPSLSVGISCRRFHFLALFNSFFSLHPHFRNTWYFIRSHIKYGIIFFRYEGLSDKFLSSPVPKILLLAGTDRLDRLVHTNIMLL